ncbi:lysozyme inhibitor LprI family protein [Azospirillum agricola]|uniref:lysozyme inhibitor LprI family protein n=1 Tax=Azospirillum agricola TaxID=1720247 RepID=UPI000A0F02AB|nr:lysozyme inhibitor LprI family protein [Azospirillum agricola]SMH59673.1 Protein of unknown function [Azospirillum lipoferum]
MRVVSLPAGLLAGLLMVGSVQASAQEAVQKAAPEAAPKTGCAASESPVAELICRDPALAAATEAVDGALKALGATTDDLGRAAIEAGQTLWRSRRDEGCPVAAADLADPKVAKARVDCLLRASRARVAALDAERAARGRPVADLPLTITDAAAPRLVAVPSRPPALTRPVSALALVGRWAKADPVSRAPIDDCRTSYLDVTREQAVQAVDPRLPFFPIEGRLAADTDPAEGMTVTGENGPVGSLRLEAAETPRLDRLVLRLAPPATFAATFVRCR